MKSLTCGRDCTPDPIGAGSLALDLHLLDISQIVADYGIKSRRLLYRKQNQVAVSLVSGQRGKVSVLRKPDGVRQADQHAVMVAGKRFGAEERVAKKPDGVRQADQHAVM